MEWRVVRWDDGRPSQNGVKGRESAREREGGSESERASEGGRERGRLLGLATEQAGLQERVSRSPPPAFPASVND